MKVRAVFCCLCFFQALLYGNGAALAIAGYPVASLAGSVKEIKEYTGSSLENLTVKRIVTLNEWGNVVTEELYTKAGLVSSRNTYSYNEEGLLKEIVGNRSGEAGQWRYEFRYDERGDLQEELSWACNGYLEWRNVYHYNRRGLLAEKVVYQGEDSETMRELYRYTDDGKLAHWLILFPDGKLLKQVDFIYNDMGLISEEKYHNEDSLYKRKRYYYNKNAVWERVQTDNGRGEDEETTLYFYNGDGQLVEKITRNADGGIVLRFVISYDHMGNEFSRIDSSGNYLLKEIIY